MKTCHKKKNQIIMKSLTYIKAYSRINLWNIILYLKSYIGHNHQKTKDISWGIDQKKRGQIRNINFSLCNFWKPHA